MLINAFYSDPHFGHKNIIKYCNRPFSDVEDMTRGLIENYNNVIGTNDVVMWLGDCSFCKKSDFNQIMKRLNGKKILVRGNHDHSNREMLQAGFEIVLSQCFLRISGKLCRLSHFPYFKSERPGMKIDDRHKNKRPVYVNGEILIHGHTHSSEKVYKNMIHVGVDAWDYKPALMSEIEEIMNKNFR